MKRIRPIAGWMAAVVLMTWPVSSCSNYASPEANSAATGGLIGAGAGALLADDAVQGAALGGALGAGAGYLYGRGQR